MSVCGKPVDVAGYRFNVPSPTCAFDVGHDGDHPCSTAPEQVGDPCHFCGGRLTAVPCAECWMPVPADLADQKALFAGIGLSVTCES